MSSIHELCATIRASIRAIPDRSLAPETLRLVAACEVLFEGNAEVIRNSRDILAKKNCSRALQAAERICAGESK